MIYSFFLFFASLFHFLLYRHKVDLRGRLGLTIPPVFSPVWIHAVSLGEIKAAGPLIDRFHQKGVPLLITTTTKTGQEEAKRRFSHIASIAYLPYDFRYLIRRWMKKIKPVALLLIESDLWPNLLAESTSPVFLVSGKLSARSFFLHRLFRPRFLQKLTLCLAQTEEMASRFRSLGVTTEIGGNLKWDMEIEATTPAPRTAITIASTHAPEEEELLQAILPWEGTLFLAPRHPERFEEVAKFLTRKNIAFTRWKDRKPGLVLVDQMGVLPQAFSESRFAIVAGSFSSRLGGHNLLEPLLYGCPVLFGPHVEAQAEMASKIVASKAGLQLSPSQIRASLQLDPAPFVAAGQKLLEEGRGAAEKSFQIIERYIYLLPKKALLL